MNRRNSRHIVKICVVVGVVAIVLGYGLFAFRDIVRGPAIEITEPANGQTFATSSTELKGISERAQFISLNGKPILIDENGAFDEVIVLSSGYNVVTVEAHDKFGHVTSQKLELVRSTKDPLENILNATSTPSVNPLVNGSSTVSSTTVATSSKATSTIKKR